MRIDTNRILVRMAITILAVNGCATSTSVTAPNDGAFRLIRASVSAPADLELLEVTAELTNTGSTALRSGGCLRPDLAIDQQTGSTWTALPVRQSAELVQCIQAFTLAPGTSQQFTTVFSMPTVAFPRGVTLRLRVLLQPSGDGPTLPITLR